MNFSVEISLMISSKETTSGVEVGEISEHFSEA